MHDEKQLHANNAPGHDVDDFDSDTKAEAQTALLNRHEDEIAPHPLERGSGTKESPGEIELSDVLTKECDVMTDVVTCWPVQASFRQKILITILIYWNMSTLGMVYAQMGPVLPDLQFITGSSLQEVTWLFTGCGIGYIAGCLLAGIAQEKFNPRLLLFVSTLGTGITAGVFPWIKFIYVSVGIKVIQGITIAGQDTVDIAMIFAIWREESGPFNQLIYIVYAAGCFLSPFYSKPFLLEEKAVQVQELPMLRNESLNLSTNGKMDELYSTDTNVHYAFLISALVSVSAALPFLFMYIFNVQDPAASQADNQDEREEVSPPVKLTCFILALSFTTSFIANSCIDMFPNLLTTFVLQQLNWTQQSASNLTAVFYAMYGVGNFIGIFVLKYSTTNKLIVASYTGTIIGLIGCVIGSVLDQAVVIWVTVVIIGASMAPIIPTLYTWIEENVAHVTCRIASGILLFGAVGIMVDPILLGYLMEKHSPMWFLYISLGGIILCSVFYALSFSLVQRCSPK